MRRLREGLCVLVSLVMLAAAASGQVQNPAHELGNNAGAGSPPTLLGIAPADCVGGEIYDDGTVENGYSGNPALISSFEGVQQFTPTSYPAGYQTVCVCLTTIASGGPTLDFEIEVRDDDGAGGAPNTLLGTVPVSVIDVPIFPATAFYGIDTTSLGLSIPDGNVWIGVRWNPMAFPSRFICADESPATPLHPGFVNFNNPDNWQTTQTVFPNYRAKLIRAIQADPVADLEITKTAAPPSVPAGGQLVYSLTVTNNGPDDATNVVVTDPLPAGVTYVSDDCGGADVPPWTWNVGNLANGAAATCNITVTVPAVPGDVSNTASVTADQLDEEPDNDSSTAMSTVIAGISEVPAAGLLGLVGLALLLGTSAVWLLTRGAGRG